jgi:hypothetical protein
MRVIDKSDPLSNIMEIMAMSNMLPSQAAPVTRVHSGGAWSVSLAVEPSIIGCHQIAVCRVCCPFAGVNAQMMEELDLPFAGVNAQ